MDFPHLNLQQLVSIVTLGGVLVTILRQLIKLGIVMTELMKWREEMSDWKGKADKTLAVVRDRLKIPEPS